MRWLLRKLFMKRVSLGLVTAATDLLRLENEGGEGSTAHALAKLRLELYSLYYEILDPEYGQPFEDG